MGTLSWIVVGGPSMSSIALVAAGTLLGGAGADFLLFLVGLLSMLGPAYWGPGVMCPLAADDVHPRSVP